MTLFIVRWHDLNMQSHVMMQLMTTWLHQTLQTKVRKIPTWKVTPKCSCLVLSGIDTHKLRQNLSCLNWVGKKSPQQFQFFYRSPTYNRIILWKMILLWQKSHHTAITARWFLRNTPKQPTRQSRKTRPPAATSRPLEIDSNGVRNTSVTKLSWSTLKKTPVPNAMHPRICNEKDT